MPTKQKVMIGIIAVIGVFLIWQVISMFKGESAPEPTHPVAANGKAAPNGTNATTTPTGPKPAQVPTVNISRDQQMELMKQQQETQARYIAALSELQMLKLAKDIAETNKDIVNAKLDTITKEKTIVELLEPKAPPPEAQIPYGQGLANPAAAVTNASGGIPSVSAAEAIARQQAGDQNITNYSVISVSELLNKWSAVLGSQGKLFSVSVGDVLPVDGATVKSIDRSGVTLTKNGAEKKLSIVPII